MICYRRHWLDAPHSVFNFLYPAVPCSLGEQHYDIFSIINLQIIVFLQYFDGVGWVAARAAGL